MATSRQKTIVYVDRTGMFFFDSQTQQLPRFNFQPTFYHDLEIVNVEEFQKQLSQFVHTSKIQPSIVSLILAPDYIFDITIAHDGKTILADEKEKFLNTVPFEQVGIKVIPRDKEDLLIATNKALYSIIIHVLEINLFQVKDVIPATPLIKDVPSLLQGFNPPVAKSLLNIHDKYKLYDFIEQRGTAAAENTPNQPKSRFKTIHILIVIFVLLMSILGYLLLRPQEPLPQSDAALQLTNPTLVATVIVSPTDAVKTSTEAATINISTIKIQLNGASSAASQMEEIKKNLTSVGISNIEPKTESQTTSSKTLLVFNQSLPQDIKDKVLVQIKKTYIDVSVQETQESSYDVIVNLANL